MNHGGEPETGQQRGRVSNDTTPAYVYIFITTCFVRLLHDPPSAETVARSAFLRSAPSGRTLNLSCRRWYMQVSGDKKMSHRRPGQIKGLQKKIFQWATQDTVQHKRHFIHKKQKVARHNNKLIPFPSLPEVPRVGMRFA